jgi:hypothetical protein
LTVTVLRLLEAERPEPHGGMVTYLAEASEPVGAVAWRGELHPHPLRQRYARRGGPASDLVWAKSALLSLGMRPEGPPVQIRTWNLSSIWRIPTHGETVWLKSVPPFFAHEAPLLSALSGQRVPTVLSCEAGRMLLREAPGEDMHDASVSKCKEMVDLLIGLQAMWRDRVDQLLSLGLPDWRGPALIPAIGEVVSRTASQLSTEERAALTGFVEQLPARLAEIASCAFPIRWRMEISTPATCAATGMGSPSSIGETAASVTRSWMAAGAKSAPAAGGARGETRRMCGQREALAQKRDIHARAGRLAGRWLSYYLT